MKGKKFLVLPALLFTLVLFLSCGKAPEESPVQSERPESQDKTVHAPGKKAAKTIRTENVPIEFFGIVTDERGNPLDLAEVVAEVKVLDQTSSQNAELQEHREWTDPDGRFSFRDLSGSQLTIKGISKDGYQAGNPEITYYYSGPGRRLHSPAEEQAVTFTLQEQIESTFLINIGGERNWQVNIGREIQTPGSQPPEGEDSPPFRFQGRGTVRHDFARKSIQAAKADGSWNDSPFTSDLEITFSIDPGRGGCSLVLSSPGHGNGVIVSDEYLRLAPETGYRDRISYHRAMGRGIFHIYVKSRSPSIYSVVKVRTMVREDNCEFNYTVSVNPYGETGFEQAWGTSDEVKSLEEEAVRALIRGELPEKPIL